jgi:hypothetical protein
MSDQATYDLIRSNQKLIESMGMHWENERRKANGEAPAYNESDFSNLAYNN